MQFRFRITALFYVMALLASGMATFGWGLGLFLSGVITFVWFAVFSSRKPPTRVEVIVIIIIATVLVALLYPATFPAMEMGRTSACRVGCTHKLMHIAKALLRYKEQKGSLPPAAVLDPQGKPMHSWRVSILPSIDEQYLCDNYDFTKPWNGGKNRTLSNIAPGLYRCPSFADDTQAKKNETQYFAVVGPQTVWASKESRSADFQNENASKTIMLIESHTQGIHWLEPRDLSFEKAVALLTSNSEDGMHYSKKRFFYHTLKGRHVVMADGSAYLLKTDLSREVAVALLSLNSDKKVIGTVLQSYSNPQLNWSRIYSLTVFILLALLPFRRAVKRYEEFLQQAKEEAEVQEA